MKHADLPELFKKYLKGECTAEEAAFIDHWYQSHEMNPEDNRLLNDLERSKLETKMLTHIIGMVKDDPSFNDTLIGKPRTVFFRTSYQIAATLLMLVLIGVGTFYYINNSTGVQVENMTSVVLLPVTITNGSNSIERHLLSDGTIINLQPKGRIEFPATFTGNQREIRLTGEAFFDVAKDKQRPFVINTDEVTIKVLGTSFNVKAYSGSREITVAVKTGKVSVSSNNPVLNPGAQEIILTPNEEAIYNTEDDNFSKKLVAEPQLILAKPTLFEMQYDATPVKKIFEVLEENYGIDIVFNEKLLADCTLTTSMEEEGLFERVEIICQAIGAHYTVVDSRIVINSAGCQ